MLLIALTLAACGSTPAPAPETTASPTATRPVTPSAGPIDCAATDGDVQDMICKDSELMALDRQLADEYRRALDRAGADTPGLESTQRGWLSGRDECWKADDVRRCVREAYLTRLTELRIGDPGTVTPPTVTYRCPGGKPFTARFYNDLDPAAAVLTWGTDSAIVFVEPSGSGARYGRDGVEYWEHQGEVTVDFYGNKFVCRTP